MSQDTPKEIISPEIDSRKTAFSHPTYRLLRKTPNEAASFNITPSATIDTTFDIPSAQVINFAESYITFNYEFKMPEAGSFQYLFKDTHAFISEIDIFDETGTHLCVLKEVQNYMKIIGRKETSFENYSSRDYDSEVLYPSNALKSSADAKRPTEWYPGISSSSISYLEPQYITLGKGHNANDANDVLRGHMKIPLSDFKNTIMSVNTDIFLPHKFIFQIKWGPGIKAGFTNNDAANPQQDNIAHAQDTEIRIKDLVMFFAIEENPIVRARIVKRMTDPEVIRKKGPWSMYLPHVTSKKISGDSSSQSINVPLSIKDGQRVQKIIHTVFARDESKNHAYDCDNVNGKKIYSYQTSINGTPRQDFIIRCGGAYLEDYMMNKRFLRGSVNQGTNMYQYNWFHCDDFTEFPAPGDNHLPVKLENLKAGLELSTSESILNGGSITWSSDMTCPIDEASNKFFHYVFAVCQKVLTINGLNVSVI